MKKILIPVFIVVALLLAAAGYLVYRAIRAGAEFQAPEVGGEERLSPYGRSFLPRLLAKLGYRVRVMNFAYRRDDFSVIIREWREDDDWQVWQTWLADGKRLILLCPGTDDDRIILPVRSSHPLCSEVENLYLDPENTLSDFDWPSAEGDREIVLGERNAPLIVQETLSGGEIVYLADPAFLSDESLIRGDNAVFINNCLKDRFEQTVVLDHGNALLDFSDLLNREEEDEPVFILFRGKFLYLFLQALLLGLVFCLVFWKRFGPARDPERFARRSLLRHLEATGNFFEKTGNPLVFVDILDRYFFTRLKEILRLTPGAKTDVAGEVRKRLRLTREEEDVFTTRSKHAVVARDSGRERIILRLKGVQKKHGKNQNTG